MQLKIYCVRLCRHISKDRVKTCARFAVHSLCETYFIYIYIMGTYISNCVDILYCIICIQGYTQTLIGFVLRLWLACFFYTSTYQLIYLKNMYFVVLPKMFQIWNLQSQHLICTSFYLHERYTCPLNIAFRAAAHTFCNIALHENEPELEFNIRKFFFSHRYLQIYY